MTRLSGAPVTAYYNEIEPFVAEWLENLILVGAIAPGIVDRRSIEDVTPADLKGFTQCHFFAGIGVWSYAPRQAGVPDSYPVWTGSCPCQPFSQAGQGAGFDDERHLWPAFHHLVTLCGPKLVLGEQVSSKDGLAWLDLVQTDMEATGYAFGALDLCAAGVGAPHIRQRSYWMAHASCSRQPRTGGSRPVREQRATERGKSRVVGVAHDARLEGRCALPECADQCALGASGVAGGLEHDHYELASDGPDCRPGPTNGYWRDVDWLGCTDGKWRPVECGAFPLAARTPNRVGALRGYGNAINAPLATEFIKTVMEYLDEGY